MFYWTTWRLSLIKASEQKSWHKLWTNFSFCICSTSELRALWSLVGTLRKPRLISQESFSRMCKEDKAEFFLSDLDVCICSACQRRPPLAAAPIRHSRESACCHDGCSRLWRACTCSRALPAPQIKLCHFVEHEPYFLSSASSEQPAGKFPN